MTETDTEAPVSPAPSARRPRSWWRATLAAALGLAVVVGLYTIYWMTAANTVRNGIDTWIAAQAQRGVSVSYRDLDVVGFPFWIDVQVSAPMVLFEGRTTAEWRLPAAQGLIRPWQLTRVDVELGGRHEIVGARRVVLSVRRFHVGVTLGARGAVDGQLQMDGVQADISRAGALKMANLGADFAWRRTAGAEPPPLRLDIGADGVVVPAGWATPLGRELASARFVGHLTGVLGHPRDPALLVNWRDGGGTLEVVKLAVDHGPLRLTGSGTFALDSELQPIGAFTARAEGYMETVDALSEIGLLGAGKATAAKLVLAVLANRPAGQTPHIEAPLTIQDRELSLESLSLLKLPRVDWSRIIGAGR